MGIVRHTRSGNGRNVQRRDRDVSRGERGMVLLTTLVIVLVVAIVATAVGQYVWTNYREIKNDQVAREDIYAGDGAIKAAVNWAKTNPDAGLDATYYGEGVQDDCMYLVDDANSDDPISVTCSAPGDSESGVPADQGLVPPEALLLTGARHNEPGPYSFPTCSGGIEGFFDRLAGWFSRSAPDYAERSLEVKSANRSQGRYTGTDEVGGCKPRTRNLPSTNDKLIVNGRIVAHGKIETNGHTIETYPPGNVAVRYPTSNINETAHDGFPEDTDPGRKQFWGADRFWSPKNSSTDLNIKDEYLPVGFNQYGALKPGYSLPVRTSAFKYDPAAWEALSSGSYEKTVVNKVPKNLVRINSCTEASRRSQPIIFLPGRYTNPATLNNFTGNSGNADCYSRTFWFAPDAFGPGAETYPELLADSTRTGAFLLDFSEPVPAPLSECGVEAGGLDSRWCVGGSLYGQASNSTVDNDRPTNPRIVVGWPTGWDPFVDPLEAVDESGQVNGLTDVTLGPASSFEGAHPGFTSWLNYWHATGPSVIDDLKSLDGQYARFEPCNTGFNFFGMSLALVCPVLGSTTGSDGRAAYITGYTGVVGQPVEELNPDGSMAAPRGRIHVAGRWGYKVGNDSVVTGAELQFHTVQSQGAEVTHCLTVPLGKAGHKYVGSGHPASLGDGFGFTLTDAQAKTLADNCGTEAQIQRLRVTFIGRGDNAGLITSANQIPSYYFDGVEISYKVPRGASFPQAANPAGTSTEDLTARSDCDSRRPGGQLIFNGDSNVYVADGALQVCGGPDPDDPGDRLVIGIYGVPAVESLKIASTSGLASSGYAFQNSPQNDLGLIPNSDTTGSAGKNRAAVSGSPSALLIGEPNATSQVDLESVRLQVGCGNSSNKGEADCAHPKGFLDSRVTANFEGYQPPPGYRVKRAQIRASFRDSGFNRQANGSGANTDWNTGSEDAGLVGSWTNVGRRKYCAADESSVLGELYSTVKTLIGLCETRDGTRAKGSAIYVGGNTKPILSPTQFDNFRQLANGDSADIDSTESLVVFDRSNPGESRLTESQITNGAPVTWATRVYCGDKVIFGLISDGCTRLYVEILFIYSGGALGVYWDYLDGIELDIEIEPDPAVVPGDPGESAGPSLLRPQSGCITAHPNYEEGRGNPDCAIVRTDSFRDTIPSDLYQATCRYFQVGCNTKGMWMGRVSVQGTIYAPSSAMEVDAVDVAYPLATRGIILRHLRLSGWNTRGNWAGDAISNEIDTTPASRISTFVACRQVEDRRGVDPCDASAGDVILTEARVRFEPPTTGAVSPTNPSYPVVESWVSNRKASR